jgi:ferritin-like metal-binding protein YciE
LFEHELGAAATFEHALAQSLEDMAEESAKKAVARAFTRQMKQSQKQVGRLERIGERLHRKFGPAASQALTGILREKEDFVGTAPADELLDNYNLRVAGRLAEYAAAVYEGLVDTAQRLELPHISHLLRQPGREAGRPIRPANPGPRVRGRPPGNRRRAAAGAPDRPLAGPGRR